MDVTPGNSDDRRAKAYAALKPVRPVSVWQDVTARISQLILDGHLQPGDQLPSEPELAERLGVGRSTVREAKRALLAEGVLRSEGKRGTFVSERPTGEAEITELRKKLASGVAAELYEARRIIEVAAAGLAATRRTQQDIRELEKLLRQIEAEWQRSGTWSAGLGFHVAVVEASHNELLTAMYSLLAQFIAVYHGPYYRAITDAQEEINGHRLLLEALKSGDATLAGEAMRHHVDSVEHRRQRAINETPDGS